jgi:uncharacterized protein YbbK (DUF523 family)
MFLVSACLAGFNTRYDGTNCLDETVRDLVARGQAIAVCPEQLGGLPTPRPAVEFRGGTGADLLAGRASALSERGEDLSSALLKGARESLRIAVLYGVREAILKDGSPSCGVGYVHVGGLRVPGRGVAAELLWQNGIRVRKVDPV